MKIKIVLLSLMTLSFAVILASKKEARDEAREREKQESIERFKDSYFGL